VTAVAVLLARGGSKGIPRKNLIDFCGKPLLTWSLEQCLATAGLHSVWVSSDSDEILDVARAHGAEVIRRPEELASDTATSEAGWRHAVDSIEQRLGPLDVVLAPQVTSPLREVSDLLAALELFGTRQYDSLFSCSVAEDLYFWRRSEDGRLESVNYDWRNRRRRQDHAEQYIENGSFYLFTPDVLRRFNNRFGEHIGMVPMAFWKAFEIDSQETLRLCAALMREFLMER
jgi:CMP-N,N'-diacetyllegionaminic acid synthase